jgi:ABC-type Fe3+/spermidine/putrescine transport system ATPase subunit
VDAFVRVDRLRKRYGDLAAVDGVSFEVAEGQTLALLGPSGCGKTTIVRSIAGLESPDEGSIAIAGSTVLDAAARINLPPQQRELGMVPQSYAVWPHMSVGGNVGFPLEARGIAGAERQERVDRMLDVIGLSAVRDKPAAELSSDQQQRVALARALVCEPRLVLLDEPLSDPDPQVRERVRLELKMLQERLGFTAVYATRDQAGAFALGATVAVMNRGRIEAAGPAREVFQRPRTPFVARFLGLNVWPGRLVGAKGVSQGPDGQSYAQVTLANGFSVWGLIGDEAGITDDAPVVACVRKEHIGVRKIDAGAQAPDGRLPAVEQRFAGKVRAASFLGLEEEYMIVVEGVELRAVRPPSGVRSGDTVEVSIRPQHCMVFLAPDGSIS